MKGIWFRLFSTTLLSLALSGAAGSLASAHGWHRWHRHYDDRGHLNLFLGFNFGPPVYYPPPVYYAPPPRVIYVVPSRPSPECRRFQGEATIDASGQPFYGVACLRADGRWHIVN